MATIDITMSVDGGDHLNEIDLRRLKELWEHYSPSMPPSPMYQFDRLKDRIQDELARHIRQHQTWFGCRPIHVRGAMLHRVDQFDRHLVILPKRVTWEAVNYAYDYLRHQAPDQMEQDFDSTIRHWAGDNLAKYLDVHGGFSRQEEDRQDCFNLIQVLQESKRHLYNTQEVIGGTFDVEAHGNLERQRENELLFLAHKCKPLPM